MLRDWGAFRIHVGDCREAMGLMADRSVQCCVTSPPYFGLRDYGHAGQIGLEPTPDKYVAQMVEVFRGVHRVLKDDGTLWLNLGDSYCTVPHGPKGANAADPKYSNDGARVRHGSAANRQVLPGLKHKDLLGIPWRVALSLQQPHYQCARCSGWTHSMRWLDVPPQFVDFDEGVKVCPECRHAAPPADVEAGWFLRQDIIWHKPNPMPESVTDRCTKAHEYVFLFSKSPRYYFDSEAMKEPAVGALAGNRKPAKGAERQRSRRDSFKRDGSKREQTIPGQGYGTHRPDRAESEHDVDMRNRRSVWSVATRPYKGAHFATYPPALIEPCVLAGSRPGDLVLDPFGGSGTTGEVACKAGRRAVLCELNPAYADLAVTRIAAAVWGVAV